jgi:multidrug resistance protein, MATE family
VVGSERLEADKDLEHRHQGGDSYITILHYWWPEAITAFILYSLLNLYDAWLISHLRDTSSYAALGAIGTFIHFITKVAEGLSVGTMVLCGQYNGHNDRKSIGRVVSNAVLLTCGIGLVIAVSLYGGAKMILHFYQLPAEIIAYGVPFLRIRAVSIAVMFVYFALLGFLRGIKNTRLPMIFFVSGAFVFIVFDYVLIYGALGIPGLQIQGSAYASLIQYSVMLIMVISYIFLSSLRKTYGITLLWRLDFPIIGELFMLSWPVMLDKATLAIAKIWLVKLISPLGTEALASFTVIRDLEQLAFIPALACAQVTTLLVSNYYGAGQWITLVQTLKRILWLALLFVGIFIGIFCIQPTFFIEIFDSQALFSKFAGQALPFLGVLILFDVLQLILSSALRGAGDVNVVLITRVVGIFGFFIPCSYLLSHVQFANPVIKFVVVYGSFYISNGLMSVLYIKRLRGQAWRQHILV